jgi:hypothetical protein
MQPHDIKILNIGDDYLETIGIKMLEGRGFPSVSNFDDENSFLVNEAAVRGRCQDFNFESLFTQIEPLVIDYMDLEKIPDLGDDVLSFYPVYETVGLEFFVELINHLYYFFLHSSCPPKTT